MQGSTAPFQPVETTGRFIILPTLKILFMPAEMGRSYARNNILLTKTKLCKTTYRNGKNPFVIDRVNYNSLKNVTQMLS